MQKIWAFIFIVVMNASFAGGTQAKTVDPSNFAKIPVLHEGRIKPMESFAENMLEMLSGRNEQSLLWLVETIFNPALGEQIQVIRISNPDVLNMLELEKRENKLYSYKEVSAALSQKQEILFSIIQTNTDEWTSAQAEFVNIQKNTVALGDLLSSLSLFLPLSAELPDTVEEELQPYANKDLSYYDIIRIRQVLEERTLAIVESKGDALDTYTDVELGIMKLSFAYQSLQASAERSELFKVIPIKDDDAWQSPWRMILDGKGGPDTRPLFENWKSLALAYHDNKTEQWSELSETIYRQTLEAAGEDLRVSALYSERFYNFVKPFVTSSWFYVLSILCVYLAFVFKSNLLTNGAVIAFAAGILFHLLGIGLRVHVLDRPPVSTLYESVVFVGLVVVLYSFYMALKDKKIFWIVSGPALGVLMHLVGISHDRDGDSFLMLTAVLNTNFWLATHVICMTVGYAFCALVSVQAHYALGQKVFTRWPEFDFKTLHVTALLALLFSTVGTVLGGIWADQSWGRFWGWDPKENGALLIVLWLVWILHGRISGQMGQTSVFAGLSYLSVILAISWFGVNLLGVGLHSYGFSDATTIYLFSFLGFETALIGMLYWFALRKEKRHAH